uniref:Cortactin-binding protein-2 N-terminal domain-containing protein n=1 Tax=Ditylenchus dipsaci TaxID=166011 RepID=A0A915DJD4_9BILA
MTEECSTTIQPQPSPSTSKSPCQFSTSQLLELLSRYEAEIQAKDVALAVLQAQKARHLLENVKAVQLGPSNGPELALLRDSVTVAFDRSDVGLARDFCRSQLHQLDNFIAIQRICNQKAKQAMNVLEKRHSKILDEIDLAKEREKSTVLKSDDVFALLDNERLKMQKQLDKKDEEIKLLEDALDQSDKLMTTEKERHKLIVLYLIHERKQLLLQLNDLKRRLNTSSQTEPQLDSSVVNELKKQVVALSGERDALRKTVNSLNTDKDGLQKKVVYLEEDLMLIRQNILLKTKQNTNDQLVRRDTADGLIMANKVALASEKQQFKSHMPTSASFPSGSSSSSSSESMGQQGWIPTSNLHFQPLHCPVAPFQWSSPSTSQPQLGIKATTSKASNLPVNRNLASHLPGTNYRTNRRPTAEPSDRMEIIVMDASPNNTASLTKRSSSLPRNTVHSTQFINHTGYRLPPNMPNNNNNVNGFVTDMIPHTLTPQQAYVPSTATATSANVTNNNNNISSARHITTIVPITKQRDSKQ